MNTKTVKAMNKLILIFSICCAITQAQQFQQDLNGLKVVSNPTEWNLPAYKTYLVQVWNGYAVFKSALSPVMVGIKVSSLNALSKGIALHHLSEFGKGACLRYLGQTQVEDQSGFPAKLVTYSSEACQ